MAIAAVAGVVVGVVACVLGTWWLLARAVQRWGRHDPLPGAKYDAIVVPGARVRLDGTATPALARRTHRAVELWQQGHAPIVVLTGAAIDGRPSEASVAAAFAGLLGLPRDVLVLEERSTSTEENARFTRDVLQGGSVLVVTEDFHLWRARRHFRRHFPVVGTAGVTAPGVSPRRSAEREVAVIVVETVRGIASRRR